MPYTTPVAWFAEHEQFHPVWRALRREAGPEAWAEVRERSVRTLAAHDEPGEGYRTTNCDYRGEGRGDPHRPEGPMDIPLVGEAPQGECGQE